MRRGTPSAVIFGELVHAIRLSKNKVMLDIGEIIGCAHSNISNYEKGTRAIKEEKIAHWALALEVSQLDLLELWKLSQGWIPTRNGRRVFCTDPVVLSLRIDRVMKHAAPTAKYEIDVSSIAPEGPIVRNRGKSVSDRVLQETISSLVGPERERVLGYIQCLIDSRS